MKQGESFACNHTEWTHIRNIKQMYDVIYAEMLDTGITIAREKCVFTDREGYDVDDNQRFGFMQDILINKPNYLSFADESGFNTFQKNDGRVGGVKHAVERRLCSR